ncbi:hypothetical protein ACI48D_25060 [Massilia sp. LXY-6]|uniref:hypothetical protein n=1 Tax=Massilia sp. LXY-6 TaxID=3379823 RepID=UPI003EE312F0
MDLKVCMLVSAMVVLSGCSFMDDLAEHDPVRTQVLAELGQAAPAPVPGQDPATRLKGMAR